jgi:hypothetical protein
MDLPLIDKTSSDRLGIGSPSTLSSNHLTFSPPVTRSIGRRIIMCPFNQAIKRINPVMAFILTRRPDRPHHDHIPIPILTFQRNLQRDLSPDMFEHSAGRPRWRRILAS